MASGYSGKSRNIPEKRKFPRFPVMKTAICYRFGRKMNMRTIDISLGGLKLEANFDLAVGEAIDLAILTDGTRIHCKGKVLGIEDLRNKVQARLRFAHTSDMDFRKLSDYLNTLSGGKGIPLQRSVISGLLILSAFIAYLIMRAYLFR
jgi:hypothetical protein